MNLKDIRTKLTSFMTALSASKTIPEALLKYIQVYKKVKKAHIHTKKKKI